MKRQIRLLFLTAAASGFALGGPVTWTLQNPQFNDGGTANGFFVFDRNIITDWNITTTAGSAFSAFNYIPSDSTASFLGFIGLVHFFSNDENRILTLQLKTLFPALGGTVDLVQVIECLNCNNSLFRRDRDAIGGSVVGTVPEPRSSSIFAFALLALYVARRRIARR